MTTRIRDFLRSRREDGPCLVVDLDLVRENYNAFAKALPDTRVYYAAVLEYVEIWERWMAESLPVEVWRKLNHTEDNLAGFYRHISESHDRLRSKLVQGAA